MDCLIIHLRGLKHLIHLLIYSQSSWAPLTIFLYLIMCEKNNLLTKKENHAAHKRRQFMKLWDDSSFSEARQELIQVQLFLIHLKALRRHLTRGLIQRSDGSSIITQSVIWLAITQESFAQMSIPQTPQLATRRVPLISSKHHISENLSGVDHIRPCALSERDE